MGRAGARRTDAGAAPTGRPLSLRSPEGLRWSCTQCGSCCSSGFDLGPVEPEVIRDLKAADISTKWPAARHGWAHQRLTPGGQSAWFLEQSEQGRCVFLRDDDLCAVHVLLGADAKPGFCQQFPYHLVADPSGTVAVVRPMCDGFHRSFEQGAPVAASVDEVLTVPSRARVRRFAPETVAVLPGVTTDLDTWMDWETQVLSALQADPQLRPDAQVARTRHVLYQAADRTPPASRPEQAIAASTAVCTALEQVLGAVLQQPGPPARKAFAVEARDRLATARQRLEAGPLPPPSDELSRWTHLLLRSHLMAKHWRAWGRVDAGLGLFWMGWMIARAQAPPGADLATTQPAYRAWLILQANALVQHVLRRAEVALVDAFMHPR